MRHAANTRLRSGHVHTSFHCRSAAAAERRSTHLVVLLRRHLCSAVSKRDARFVKQGVHGAQVLAHCS